MSSPRPVGPTPFGPSPSAAPPGAPQPGGDHLGAQSPADGPLREGQRDALNDLRGALKDLRAPLTVTGSCRTVLDGIALLTEAEARLSAAQAEAAAAAKRQVELEAKRRRLEAGPNPPPREIERVLKAAQAFDAKLTSPDMLTSRLSEGQRSVKPKIGKLIAEMLQPVVSSKGDRMVAETDREGLAQLQRELPQWSAGWSEYVRSYLDYDLANALDDIWYRVEDEPLPLDPPALPPLSLVPAPDTLDLPTVTVERDSVEMGSAALRHGRSLLYGLMSMAGLAGLRGSMSGGAPPTTGDKLLLGLGMALMFIGAGAFGAYQARKEQLKEERRLHEQARQKAEAAVQRAVDHWLDRSSDKLKAGYIRALREHRGHLRAWVEAEVRPTLARAKQAAADNERQRADVDKELQSLKDAARDAPRALKRADEALKKARAELARGPELPR